MSLAPLQSPAAQPSAARRSALRRPPLSAPQPAAAPQDYRVQSGKCARWCEMFCICNGKRSVSMGDLHQASVHPGRLQGIPLCDTSVYTRVTGSD
ncbi:hypothetical protein F7725_028255 [Dissostichus mawsoni]|uniref:Uncharacterized protein n=1 Tax=Dissostichus mawsoni TaxID=36200 RepID=A0A7J5XGG0_DISMA|nr:hypothetical protein F7725_028255 [Dissostichus mawsoni]